MKRTIITSILAILLGVSSLQAQQCAVTLGIKAGRNYSLGALTALYADASYTAHKHLAIQGGAQYSTLSRLVAQGSAIDRLTLELRPAYFHDLKCGRLQTQLLLHYTHQASTRSYALGCGAELDTRLVDLTLGYYYRTIGIDNATVKEPFNIYYALRLNCLPNAERWRLDVVFSNCLPYELERHYQPSYTVECWWHPTEHLGVQLGLNYKPAGMFHISSDYYQLYSNIGLCYKW